MASLLANSGSWSPTISLDQWNSFLRSSCGTPISPAMACSGSSQDTCSTKSPDLRRPLPRRCAGRARARSSRRRSTARGVKAARDDLAQPGVLRGVHVEQDELAAFDLLADRAVFVAWQGGLLQAGEDVAAQRDLLHVLVLGHHPEAAVVESAHPDRLLVPPDRRGPAQLGQLFHRQPLGVDVRVGEIESGRQIRPGGRLGGRHIPTPRYEVV